MITRDAVHLKCCMEYYLNLNLSCVASLTLAVFLYQFSRDDQPLNLWRALINLKHNKHRSVKIWLKHTTCWVLHRKTWNSSDALYWDAIAVIHHRTHFETAEFRSQYTILKSKLIRSFKKISSDEWRSITAIELKTDYSVAEADIFRDRNCGFATGNLVFRIILVCGNWRI